MTRPVPLRVLHVLHRMHPGGVETWLMRVLRRIDPAGVRMDFLVHTQEEAAYDRELHERGVRILRMPARPRSPGYGRALERLLRAEGPYDAVHSHVHFFSGVVLRAAHRAGVPVRIAHSHLDTRDLDRAAAWPRRLYLGAMAGALRRHATAGLACSAEAAAALFGDRWSDDPRWRIHRYAIDPTPFRQPVDRDAVRRELGLPPGAFVVGHVGRFDPQKNHRFLLRIGTALVAREPAVRLVLVGDGPLRPAVQDEAARLGLGGKAIFLGLRSDVPRLFRAFDVLLLPSLREGLPVVGLEAQAAGVPLVLSDTISPDTAVVPELVRWCSLRLPPETWAGRVLDSRPVVTPATALARLESGPFGIEHGVRELEQVYAAA